MMQIAIEFIHGVPEIADNGFQSLRFTHHTRSKSNWPKPIHKNLLPGVFHKHPDHPEIVAVPSGVMDECPAISIRADPEYVSQVL